VFSATSWRKALQPLLSLKQTFLAFFSIFLVGSLLCGVAVNSNMFIVGRAVAGVGSSGLYSGSMAILGVLAPLSKRALYIGLLASLFGAAVVVGPLVGGVLTTKATWRWCFYLNLPAGALTLAALVLFFKPPRRDSEKQLTVLQKIQQLDLVGCAFFIPSIVMILLAIQWGGHHYAWKSATIIGLFCGFGCLIGIFLAWEYFKGDQAMIPFSILLNRSVSLSCIYVLTLMLSYVLCVYYLPEWFQIIRGADPLHSGLMQLPSVISQIIASAAAGLIGKILLLHHSLSIQ
jgi:MFS family permease